MLTFRSDDAAGNARPGDRLTPQDPGWAPPRVVEAPGTVHAQTSGDAARAKQDRMRDALRDVPRNEQARAMRRFHEEEEARAAQAGTGQGGDQDTGLGDISARIQGQMDKHVARLTALSEADRAGEIEAGVERTIKSFGSREAAAAAGQEIADALSIADPSGESLKAAQNAMVEADPRLFGELTAWARGVLRHAKEADQGDGGPSLIGGGGS